MKTSKLNLLFLFAAMLLFTGMHHLQAQQEIDVQNDGKKITIIKKYTDENGAAVTEKIVKDVSEGFDLDNIMDGLGNVDINIRCDKKMNRMENNFMQGMSSHRSNNNRGKLGVYLDTDKLTMEGIRISEIINGSAADKGGLREGDIIVTINGESTNGYPQLKKAMRAYEIGDEVAVKYLRDDNYLQTDLTLQGPAKRKNYYTYRNDFKRAPCKPFIGVTLVSRGNQDGVLVTRIVENTPAQKADLQSGDRITAIDGTPVTTQREIIKLRDLHKAGDYFTMDYLRDGEIYQVEAQFPSCGTETEVPETINTAPSQIPNFANNELQLKSISAFPNPTNNKITLQFSGEPQPTTVQLIDALGRVLMTEQFKEFDGNYNNTIDLSNFDAGLYFINIIQDQKMYTERIVVNGDRI